jgi:uncharacterized protein with HEPN domain
MRDDSERILDMLEAIGRIERHSGKGRQAFQEDELIQTWVVHHLEVVGEAASKLGQDFRNTHPEIPWPQIIAMRNVLTHEYFGIDLEEVWQVIERDLPELKQNLNKIREGLAERGTHD